MNFKTLLLLFVVVYSHNIFARSGLSEKNFYTPGGNNICDCDNMINYDMYAPSILGFEKEIPKIKYFYFYKKYIIGYSDSLFFLFDEGNAKLETYSKKETWEKEIVKQNLSPIIKRWLTIDDNPQDKFLIFFFLSYIIVPISLLFFFFYIKTFIKTYRFEKFNLKKTNTRIFIILSIFLLWVLSEIFWIESI